jgi:Hemerythrin HHE cation binding domain
VSLQTTMQSAPARANELFARLGETSDGAVKTREKLFSELKAELELYTGLEDRHLLPILRKSPETKQLAVEVANDNRDLRAKLAELEALPKSDAAFPEKLSELRKAFRQRARDEKRELLPAVQRALSEEQVQGVAERIEAGLAEAEQAKRDETEERRAKARQEREVAERQAEQEEAAEQARRAEAAQARRDEAKQRQAEAEREHERTERQAAAERHAGEAARAAAEMSKRTASAASEGIRLATQTAADGALRAGTVAIDAYAGVAQAAAWNLQAIATLPRTVLGGAVEIRSAWLDWLNRTTRAGAQTSHELLQEVTERQGKFAAEAVLSWMEHNGHVLEIALRVAQENLGPFESNREAHGRGLGR